MENMGRKIFNISVVALLLALVYFVAFADGLGKAPNLSLTTQQGETINLSKPMKPILVNFWATSCPGCITEMPHLAQIKNRLGDRFELIAVSMDYDPASQVKNFIAAHDFPFTYIQDTDGKIAKAFGDILLTPTSFLIAPNGNIVYQKIGEVDFDMVEARIKQLSPQI